MPPPGATRQARQRSQPQPRVQAPDHSLLPARPRPTRTALVLPIVVDAVEWLRLEVFANLLERHRQNVWGKESCNWTCICAFRWATARKRRPAPARAPSARSVLHAVARGNFCPMCVQAGVPVPRTYASKDPKFSGTSLECFMLALLCTKC